MRNNKGMILPILILLVAIFIAVNAGFFSIFGISMLFSGASLSVIIMASSLEIGKLIAVSFVYRYWKVINCWLKLYLMVGIIILMLITSFGIFGYLSRAYMGSTINFEKLQYQLEYYDGEVSRLEIDRNYLKEELNEMINVLPDNYVTSKRKLREEYNPKISELTLKVSDAKEKLNQLRSTTLDEGLDIGPIIYVAKVFNLSLDDVVKYFMMLLIFVFDPLAISLIIAVNILFENRLDKSEEESDLSDTSAIIVNTDFKNNTENTGDNNVFDNFMDTNRYSTSLSTISDVNVSTTPITSSILTDPDGMGNEVSFSDKDVESKIDKNILKWGGFSSMKKDFIKWNPPEKVVEKVNVENADGVDESLDISTEIMKALPFVWDGNNKSIKNSMKWQPPVLMDDEKVEVESMLSSSNIDQLPISESITSSDIINMELSESKKEDIKENIVVGKVVIDNTDRFVSGGGVRPIKKTSVFRRKIDGKQ